MTLLALLVVCLQLSIVAIGGATAVLPELQRAVVDVHHWMSARAFGDLFALAQAAPGPNILVVTLVGFRVAGLSGAIVATVGILLPSGALTWFVADAWHRFRDRPWRRVVQSGLVPLTVGLVAATAVLLTRSTTTGWVAALLTGGVAALSLRTRLHPLVLLGCGAALGVLGLV